MPELRHLRAFVAVAEELNFTRAAMRLHIAQQAVSRAVAQLEAELGATLLERTTHEVGLTPAGVALLESGRRILLLTDEAFEEVRRLERGLSGTIHIGVTPAVGPRVRAQAVAALRDGAAEVSVSFREVRPDDLEALLRKRSVAAVLARTYPDSPEIQSAALPPTAMSLYVPPGHRLAGRAEPVALAGLNGERLMVWNPPGTPFTDLLVDRLAAAGARVETVLAPVIGGGEPPDLLDAEAVALLPQGWPAGARSVVVALAEEVTLPLALLWPTGTRGSVVERLAAGITT